MQEIILRLIEQYGYFGVALLIAVENLFPPIPSEVILTFSGFMTTYTNLNVASYNICHNWCRYRRNHFVLYRAWMVSTEYLNRLISGKLGANFTVES